ncbi:YqiA/YcfP family alpha/beta fold hydrolase [Thermoleptolyngbya sp. M55_K2018_002]|uniref:YqiA/YcfP family alpha/beta fold hydrolase n=1 Tax=Thermoleptolyngbya sp. M55_K2018_002 TaxID=2747808 RepID=UPI001A0E3E90|nr:YqiA/YcfP family alpha/beta fold hydrolase [Thermoleptolyngbya sp. M55_K2018_002]HIK39946.1 alpha/beta fold hydrolase [Thermoleptolyngbya sp. M55_K2018_002]
MVFYCYLHGFASSPNSAKARYLGDRFRAAGLSLVIPDLNQNDFAHLTLSRQIAQVEALLPPPPEPVVLIGSSLGGLTAAWLGDSRSDLCGNRYLQVQKLVLLAPAFGFLDHWLPRLGPEQVAQWQETGFLSVYHYGDQAMRPLHYGFVLDAAMYDHSTLKRPVPTLILHGIRDDVIPVQSSRDYAATRPWVTLLELDSDHALTDQQDAIWQAVQTFCEIDLELS